MEKEFIPYELALKLKQLGFDEPCLALYLDNDKKTFTKCMEGCDTNSWLKEHMKVYGSSITAPLFQQAFRWFREKYDLHYEIHHVKSIVKRLKYKPKKVTELVEYTYEVDGALIDVVDTYEEAELACLEKLIEIVEKA